MRLLWLLPKAAPALLRHLAGYVDLLGQEMEEMQRDFGTRLVVAAVVGVSVFFVVLSGCLVVVAMTWDTPYRVAAMAWMGGAFLLIAVIAAAYGFRVVNRQAPFLGTVRREWQADRVILERILASRED
jgi:uncharacterized membrane protein YqjE